MILLGVLVVELNRRVFVHEGMPGYGVVAAVFRFM